MAQAVLIDKSATPAAAAIRTAEATAFFVSAAAARNAPLSTRVVDATPQRPIFKPRLRDQRSVHRPPRILEAAPLISTILDHVPALPAENPRASRRYVGSHVR